MVATETASRVATEEEEEAKARASRVAMAVAASRAAMEGASREDMAAASPTVRVVVTREWVVVTSSDRLLATREVVVAVAVAAVEVAHRTSTRTADRSSSSNDCHCCHRIF